MFGASLMAHMVKNLPECRRPGYDPWVSKIPWRRKWQSTPVFLPGRFHGLRSLVGYSPWSLNESEMTEWLSTHTHSVRSSWFYREYKYGIKVLTEALTWYKYSRKRKHHSLWGLRNEGSRSFPRRAYIMIWSTHT